MRRELILNFHGLGMPHSGVGADEEPFWLSRRTFVAMIDRIAFMGEDAGAPTSITFDDGNASDATIALPELVKRGLTATFFVCADRIGLPHYLDRSAIDDLLQAGMAIGSHGMRHCDWRKLDDGALDEEISGARARLADVCGKPVQMASIPFGSYDRRVLARLRREDLDCVHTSDGGLARSGAWLKPRQSLDVRCSARDLEQVAVASPTAWLRRRAAMFYKALR
jgi:peptidoglycan/xylan/chitin deacetylase (PgdA/CDA1 family)